MCLILTVVAALCFTGIFFVLRWKNSYLTKPAFNAMLMFWAAVIMWSVDCTASLISGGSFFDISVKDTVLGIIILACGLAVFAFMAVMQKIKRSNKKIKGKS